MDVKLYFLINSLAGGGAEKVAVRLSEHLPVSDFILLERDVKYKTDKPIFFLSNHSTKTNPIIKTLSIPIYVYKLLNFIEKNSLVVSFLERANFVNVISKLFKKHKAIISVRIDQQTGHFGLRKLNKLLVRILYPKADLVIAVSQGVKQSLINLGIEEEKINGLSEKPFQIHCKV